MKKKKTKCKEKCFEGHRCPHEAVLFGYCIKHYKMFVDKKMKRCEK